MKPVVHLHVLEGPHKGERLTVPEEGMKVGFDSRNELAIADDTLSRVHCRFFFRAGDLWVEDLVSQNGTLVNGAPVTNQMLKRKDLVAFGSTRIRVEHARLEAKTGLRARVSRHREEAPAPVAARRTSWFERLAWLALILWWGWLAFSLCLPPPAPLPAPAPAPSTVTPAPAAAAPTDDGEGADAMSTAAAAPAPAAPAQASAMDTVLTGVAERLAALDFPGAATLVTAATMAERSPDELETLGQVGAYIGKVDTLARSVQGVLQKHVGKTIALHMRGEEQRLRVLAVAETRLTGQLTDANGAERSVTLEITKLPLTDRAALLGSPRTPEEHALQAVVCHRAGRPDLARQYAAKAGLLADALMAQVTPASAARPPL